MTGKPAQDDLWVFGYGSLLWSPCFEPVEHQVARLEGYHRSFCMWSVHYRGTVMVPGLVLALDEAEDASCEGIAFRVAGAARNTALAQLRARELVSAAYREAWLPVALRDGRVVEAVTYVIDPLHEQYAAHLSLAEQAEIIARAHGERGANRVYLENTYNHLRDIGLHDEDLAWLVAAVGRSAV